MLHSLNRCIRVKQIKHIVGHEYTRDIHAQTFSTSHKYTHTRTLYMYQRMHLLKYKIVYYDALHITLLQKRVKGEIFVSCVVNVVK